MAPRRPRRLRKRPRNESLGIPDYRGLRNITSDDSYQLEIPSTPLPLHRFPSDSMEQPSENIEIAESCLFIPIALAAWWYWTKKVTKNVVREVITDVSVCREPASPQADIESRGSSTTPYRRQSGDAIEMGDPQIENETPPPLHGNKDSDIDQFDSWEAVVGSAQPQHRSTRFVRWIRGKRNRKPLADRSKNFDTFDTSLCGSYSNMPWQQIHDMSGIEICSVKDCDNGQEHVL